MTGNPSFNLFLNIRTHHFLTEQNTREPYFESKLGDYQLVLA